MTARTHELAHRVYFDEAFTRPASEHVRKMREMLAGVKYDTIVGTGLSGTVFVAQVAGPLRKKFAILRKPDDKSTHSGNRLEGRLGKSYVIADDFISSGSTITRIVEFMADRHPEVKFMGVYSYQGAGFQSPTALRSAEGLDFREFAIGPKFGPLTKEQSEASYSHREIREPLDGWDEETEARLYKRRTEENEAYRMNRMFDLVAAGKTLPNDFKICDCGCKKYSSESRQRVTADYNMWSLDDLRRDYPEWYTPKPKIHPKAFYSPAGSPDARSLEDWIRDNPRTEGPRLTEYAQQVMSRAYPPMFTAW